MANATRLLHGDLGYAYDSSAPVRSLLASRLPVTASLALGAAVPWLVVGVGVGAVGGRIAADGWARRPRWVSLRG
jgi:peptide/nickel transport system permease protein